MAELIRIGLVIDDAGSIRKVTQTERELNQLDRTTKRVQGSLSGTSQSFRRIGADIAQAERAWKAQRISVDETDPRALQVL